MSDGLYKVLKTSTLAYCKGFLTRNTSITNTDVFDFDSHASLQELPEKDLIGISEFSVENSGDTYYVNCIVTICTKSDDSNILRLTNIMDKMFSEIRPGATGDKFKVVDSAGTRLGNFTVKSPVEATPVMKSKTRPIQGIMVSLAIACASPLA